MFDDLFENRIEIADKLSKFLEDRDISIVSLSKGTGVSRPTLYKLLRGEINNKVSFDKHVQKTLRFLEITPEELINYGRKKDGYKKKLDIPEFVLPPEAIVKVQGSSRGTQPKYYADKIWFKANSLGYEDDAECLASIVLRHSNVRDFVTYKKCMINNRRGCMSKDFLDNDETFISFAKLYSSVTDHELAEILATMDGPSERMDFIKDFINTNYHLDVREYLSEILAFDMLVVNVDRHLNNLGIIVKADGRARRAPVFDNGGALLSDVDRFCNPDYKKDLERATGYPFSANLEYQASCAGIKLKINYDSLLKALENYDNCKAKDVLLYQLERYRRILNV